MDRKVLLQIKDTEAAAQALVANAKEEALQVVLRAEEESAAAFLRFSESCRQEIAERKGQAEMNASQCREDFAKETLQLCEFLRRKLSAQKPRAVDAIIEMITA